MAPGVPGRANGDVGEVVMPLVAVNDDHTVGVCIQPAGGVVVGLFTGDASPSDNDARASKSDVMASPDLLGAALLSLDVVSSNSMRFIPAALDLDDFEPLVPFLTSLGIRKSTRIPTLYIKSVELTPD